MVGESFLIVKISRTKKPFWGVGKKYIDFFDKLDNYFLVLLLSPKEGYVYNKNEITYNIDNDYWRLREADQNYKIYPAVIKERNYFFGPKQFLLKIGMEKL